jgi:ribosomal protein L5
MAKAFCTSSSEVLRILAGMTPITIKTNEAVKQYNIRKGKESLTHLFDSEVELKNWLHLAHAVKIKEAKEYKEQTIQAYTDGSKNEKGGSI